MLSDLHLCPSDDGRLAVVFRVHRRCSSTDVVAVVAERVSRRSAEHRSRISWLAACRLMDGVLARNFSHAIWHCAASVLSPQHVSLTYKTHDEHKYTRYIIYILIYIYYVVYSGFDKYSRRRPRLKHNMHYIQGDYFNIIFFYPFKRQHIIYNMFDLIYTIKYNSFLTFIKTEFLTSSQLQLKNNLKFWCKRKQRTNILWITPVSLSFVSLSPTHTAHLRQVILSKNG